MSKDTENVAPFKQDKKNYSTTHLFDLLDGALSGNIHLNVDSTGQQEIHSHLIVAIQGCVRPHIQLIRHGGRHGREHTTTKPWDPKYIKAINIIPE